MNPEELAKKIRNQYQPYNAATPIVRILKSYEFQIYKKFIDTLFINDKNKKIITVNKGLNIYEIRILLAYELADYLLDKDKIQKDIFVKELMMPEALFRKQYEIAKKKLNLYSFVVEYLSRYFEVPQMTIHNRIKDF